MPRSAKRAGASDLHLQVGLNNYFIISLATSSSVLSLMDYCTYLHCQALPYPEPEGEGLIFLFIKISSFGFPWEPTITAAQLYPYLNKIHNFLVCSSILTTYNIVIILRKNNKKNGSLTYNAPVSLYSHSLSQRYQNHVSMFSPDMIQEQDKKSHFVLCMFVVSFREALLSQLIVH